MRSFDFFFGVSLNKLLSCRVAGYLSHHVAHVESLLKVFASKEEQHGCQVITVQWSWWRHEMETFSALLALCEGNPPVTFTNGVTRSFDVFFDLCLSKRLSKESRRRWFETPSRSLWRHCNGSVSLPPNIIVHKICVASSFATKSILDILSSSSSAAAAAVAAAVVAAALLYSLVSYVFKQKTFLSHQIYSCAQPVFRFIVH